MHVRLVWVDAEGDPEEKKPNRNKEEQGRGGGGRQPNTENFAIRGTRRDGDGKNRECERNVKCSVWSRNALDFKPCSQGSRGHTEYLPCQDTKFNIETQNLLLLNHLCWSRDCFMKTGELLYS